MADSATGDLMNTELPKISLSGLPAEMLWSILSHSNLVSLMRLSATCSTLRYQVHEIVTSRITAQAIKHPEVRRSLDRIGWKKQHNFWDCKCFKIMGGPCFTWSQLEECRSFSTVCNTYLSKTSTTTAGKTFFVTSERQIRYGQIASRSGTVGQNSFRTLASFNNVVTNVALASYDNVLAFSLKKYVPRRSVSVCIFNVSTLVEVSEINLCYDEDDTWVLNRSIAITRDTMAVCLDYFIQREPETKIQIWKINTFDPQVEGISLLYTMSHDTALLSKQLFHTQSLCVNDRFTVIFDVVIKVFGRSEDNPLVRQVEIENKTLKAIAMQGGEGDYLAVALKSVNDDYVPKLTVNVYSVSRGDLIVQKEMDPFPRWSSPFYMKWFGDHLIIGCHQDNILSFFSWQAGLTRFLSPPCGVPVLRRSRRGSRSDTAMWTANCLHVDFDGLTTAVHYQRGGYLEKMVHFKNWKTSS